MMLTSIYCSANVSFVAPGQSTAQGIRRLQNGTLEAGGEPRQVSSGGVVF
jgi:gamma-glutamyltranspeptidase/glutathione hydrolase